MAIINEMIQAATAEGFFDENAEAFVCQNLVLLAFTPYSIGHPQAVRR